VLSWGPHTTCGPRAACLTYLTQSMFSSFRMFFTLGNSLSYFQV
jgi:hypothetical protein